MYFLRRQHGYKGRILATAQSNVAVDNMLETARKHTLNQTCHQCHSEGALVCMMDWQQTSNAHMCLSRCSSNCPE